MRFPGIRKLRSFVQRLEFGLRRPPIVLLYHRVEEVDPDPWSLAVTPQHFSEQLEVLRRQCNPMTLTDLVEALRTGTAPKRAVVVTFDDGYNDNLYKAKPLLDQFDFPATIFLTTGALGGTREFWWDELELLYSLKAKIDPETPPGERESSTRSSSGYLFHYNSLRQLPADLIEERMKHLRQELGQPVSNRATHRTLTVDEVARIAEGGLIEVGSHTVSHPVLSAHSESKQREEVNQSKRFLEDVVGYPIVNLSYPHGGNRDFDSRTISLVREAGYQSACAAFGGMIRPSTSLYSLPRFGVGDWDGDEFDYRLRRLF